MSHKSAEKRCEKTFGVFNHSIPVPVKFLDLETDSPFSRTLRQFRYEVDNIQSEDFYFDQMGVMAERYDRVTEFKILENILNSLRILKYIKALGNTLTAAFRLRFSSAQRQPTNIWGMRHKFDDWQFNWFQIMKARRLILRVTGGWNCLQIYSNTTPFLDISPTGFISLNR